MKKTMKIEKQVSVFLLLLYNLIISGQNNNEPKLVPLAPEGYQFLKYNDLSKSSFKGTTSISIPLYQIKVDGNTIPITLDYTGGSGIPVDESPTVVGLGWYLSIGGGSITRSVTGHPDVAHNVIRSDYQVTENDPLCSPDPQWRYDHDMFYGMLFSDTSLYGPLQLAAYDLQPDIYSYELLNDSGKFIIDIQKNPVLIPKTQTKINGAYQGNITAIDENGVNYNFVGANLTNVSDGTINQPVTTMFKVSKISFPSGKEVKYTYNAGVNYELWSFNNQEFWKATLGFGYQNIKRFSTSHIMYNERLISEITFDTGKILFEYGDRLDVVVRNISIE